MTDAADRAYRQNFVAFLEATGFRLSEKEFDAFFDMHEEGTSSVVLACMLVLAMKEGEGQSPYDYWSEYNEDRFMRLADLTLYMVDIPEANPDKQAWPEVTIHGKKFCELVEIIKH